MDLQLTITCLLVMTASASYINHRFLKFPSSVGLTLIALILSLAIIAVDKSNVPIHTWLQPFFSLMDLNASLINPEFFISVVCFLLFAGGLHINIIELAKQKTLIAVLTTLGVITSTFIIGLLVWYVSNALNIGLSLPYCLVFGALISPTDPIAILGMLKKAKAPKALSLRITGEALFNDGIGIVIFITLLRIAKGYDLVHQDVITMLAKEILGGTLLGITLGWIGNQLLKHVHEFYVGLLITLALVMTGYTTAIAWHISAPITLAVSGMVIGYKLKQVGLSPVTAKELQAFWEMIDDVLNAILFVVIGLVVLHLTVAHGAFVLGLAAIPIVLFGRFVSVAIPIKLFAHLYTYSPYVISIMTWGGLRGGISIALALSLPQGPEKQLILTTTYAVVLFSILVQGMTIKPLIEKSVRKNDENQLEAHESDVDIARKSK
jgi:monovalent cation:H+ antiporter, CPA1 family